MQIADVIVSALPYIRKFHDTIFVIKYGGAAQIDDELKAKFAQDITLLRMVGIKVVVVHGGGKDINFYLDRLGIKSEFKDGLRVTSKETMEVVEMVLAGKINSQITSYLNDNGTKAMGICGKDVHLMEAEALNFEKYGYVGKIKRVDTDTINYLLDGGYVPVIAPIAFGTNSQTFNINADWCASAIARELKAQKVIFLSDIKGVLDKDGKLIAKLNKDLIDNLKDDGTINGGMIPKIDSCLECVLNGVESAQIIDGRVAHSLLLEVFTDRGVGSMITC